MATDSFKFWDSFSEALDPLDDATYGRVVRAVAHKVFLGDDPDFRDSPALGAVYTIIMRNSEQSRDIARRARENGSKSAGRPKKTTSQKTDKKPSGKSGLTNRREKKRSEVKRSSASSYEEATPMGAPAPVAGAPAPAPEPWDDGDYPPPPPPDL